MKRVAHVRRQAARRDRGRTPDGRTAGEVISGMRESIMGMLREQAELYEKVIRPRSHRARHLSVELESAQR